MLQGKEQQVDRGVVENTLMERVMKDMQSDWVEEQSACSSLAGAGGCKEDRQGCLTQTLFRIYFNANIIYILHFEHILSHTSLPFSLLSLSSLLL